MFYRHGFHVFLLSSTLLLVFSFVMERRGKSVEILALTKRLHQSCSALLFDCIGFPTLFGLISCVFNLFSPDFPITVNFMGIVYDTNDST